MVLICGGRQTGVSKRRFKASNGITDVKWSPDGQHLAIAVEDGYVYGVTL